jgi:hypothetical protein
MKKNDRVEHKFGWWGRIVTGNIRERDQRVLIQRDDTGERVWCAVEMLK